MRKSLVWVLIATVSLSGVAIVFPGGAEPYGTVLPNVPEVGVTQPYTAASPAKQEAKSPPSVPLPSQWPHIELEAAKRDLFAAVVSPPPPPVKVQKMPVVVQPPVMQPDAPAAPPMNYRYLGSMRRPDGEQLVYLWRGTVPLQVAAGDRLDDGYVVESVTEEGVALMYPPSGAKAMVPIPPTSAGAADKILRPQ